MPTSDEALRIYRDITEYCETYNIPIDNLLDILEDQKVLPMIRGKATEYIGAAFLRQSLPRREWSVEKLNLNPQASGGMDEDVSVTFKRTGKRLKAETKNAVRGSFRLVTRMRPWPHFTVKCHRSRSHLTRKINDRYLVKDFDIVLCNVSNSLFRGKSLSQGLPLIEDQRSIRWLKSFYGVSTERELVRKAYDDWRICIPDTIGEPMDGYTVIPRTPVVRIKDDPNWFGVDQLVENLRSLINGR